MISLQYSPDHQSSSDLSLNLIIFPSSSRFFMPVFAWNGISVPFFCEINAVYFILGNYLKNLVDLKQRLWVAPVNNYTLNENETYSNVEFHFLRSQEHDHWLTEPLLITPAIRPNNGKGYLFSGGKTSFPSFSNGLESPKRIFLTVDFMNWSCFKTFNTDPIARFTRGVPNFIWCKAVWVISKKHFISC